VEFTPLLAQGEWSPPSPLDGFCFACMYGETETGQLDNQWDRGLRSLIECARPMPLFTHCNIIKEFYDKSIKGFSEEAGEWTLNSIREHLSGHGGMKPDMCVQTFQRMLFVMGMNLGDNGVMTVDPRTKKRTCHPGNSVLLLKVMSQYTALERFRAGGARVG
jgi:hypothetical protein